MIVVFIAAFFCVLNISLWITFFIKFKKIFSTDDIIASTREEMDRMIADINHNAGRNIELIEDRIRQLKAVVAEADRHVEVARKELDNQKAAISYQQKIDAALNMKNQQPRSFTGGAGRAARQYLRNQNPENKNSGNFAGMTSDISAGLQGGNRYELTDEGSRHVQHPSQGDLFEQADEDAARYSGHIVSDAGTTFTVENDGSSYASVPVIGGNVSFADERIQPQPRMADLVHDLYIAGHSVEEIARELNSSTTEVQMVLDMDMNL